LVGPQCARLLGQKCFGFGAGGVVDIGGQVGKEALDDPQMLAVKDPGSPGFGRRRLTWGQCFTPQSGARGQWFGDAVAAVGFGGGDAQPVGQHFVRGPAEVAEVALVHFSADVVADDAVAAVQSFTVFGQP